MATRLRESHSEEGPFGDIVGPLTHHFFPDGCTIDSLESQWPKRRNRSPVSSSEALQSIERLEKMERCYNTHEIRILIALSCASQPKNGPRKSSESPLIDGSSKLWCRLLKVIQPVPEVEIDVDDLCCLFFISNIDDKGIACLLNWLNLCLRHNLITSQARLALKSPRFYNKLIACALKSTACSTQAVRILLLITDGQHARRDRCARLARCFESNLNCSAIPSLLQLYSHLNDDCPRYPYATSKDWYRSTDTQWESRFGRYLRDLNPIQLHRLGKKRSKHNPRCVDHVIALLQQHLIDKESNPLSVDSQTLLDSDWMGHIMVLLNDKERELVSTNLLLILHQAWYSPDSNHSTLVRSMARLCSHIPPRCVVAFAAEHVLPMWDGNPSSGKYLCDILPHFVCDRSFKAVKMKVLLYLEPLILYGDDDTRYLIVADCLTRFLESDCENGSFLQNSINWTNDIFTRACLAHTTESLLMAMLTFFGKGLNIAIVKKLMWPVPNFEMVYRCLWQSTTSIDGLCDLLMRYRAHHIHMGPQGRLMRMIEQDVRSLLTQKAGDILGNPSSILFSSLRPGSQAMLSKLATELCDMEGALVDYNEGGGYLGIKAFLASSS